MLGVVIGAALVTMPASFARAQSKCQARKYKAAAIGAKQKAACHARAARAGATVDAACLADADARLVRKWAKAEAAPDCVTTGDAAAGMAATDRCIDGLVDVIDPPPPPSSPCCNLAGSCAHGFDESSCTMIFGGTLGSAGSVCDGATGTCVVGIAGTGRCCMAASGGFCTAGPDLDLSGCVPPNFLDYPFASTCTPSGTCTLP